MNARQRHERQIKYLDPKLGDEFERALTAIAFRYGLLWFTDDQVAEMRDQMIQSEWAKRRRQAQSRAHYRDAVAQLTGIIR